MSARTPGAPWSARIDRGSGVAGTRSRLRGTPVVSAQGRLGQTLEESQSCSRRSRGSVLLGNQELVTDCGAPSVGAWSFRVVSPERRVTPGVPGTAGSELPSTRCSVVEERPVRCSRQTEDPGPRAGLLYPRQRRKRRAQLTLVGCRCGGPPLSGGGGGGGCSAPVRLLR